MAKSVAVTATGPSGKTRTYASQRSLANTMAGTAPDRHHASERARMRIRSAIAKGGAYVGNVFVQSA